jgi:AraC family transcriptional activator of pyochelin receptor
LRIIRICVMDAPNSRWIRFNCRMQASALPMVSRPQMRDGLEFVRSGLSLTAGTQWNSIAEPGLSIGLAAEGKLEFSLPGLGDQAFAAPCGFTLAMAMPVEIHHHVHSEGPLVCTHLHLPLEAALTTLEAIAADHAGMQALTGRGGLSCLLWRATPALSALTRDVFHCPYTGTVRSLYLQGKAFEFLALAIESTRQSVQVAPQLLTASDVERLYAARAILLVEYVDPPCLDVLGHRVGLSVTRLTAGFRRLFSTSIVAFVQLHRMRLAHDAITSGRMSVAQAAHAAGYTPSYFSSLFRRRFGIAPSALRATHL